MSGPDIFLSYARTDRDVARLFAERFVDEGFTVWWDASLHSGETFDEVIEQNLRDSKAVVVLWSPRSVASRWVRAEATQADRKNKLAPAIIEPCDRPIIFELTHAAELCGWAGDTTDRRWRIFMEDLRHLIERSGHAAAPTAQPPAFQKTEEISGQAPLASRRPLRPGSDEVIFAAGRKAPEAPAEPAPEPAIRQQPVEADAQAEVHCLEIDDPELGEQLYVIDSGGVKIGRTAPADIVVAHKTVSREHCSVGIANDELLVTDLNSTNGTYVDDERINRSTILPVGSVLRLGQVSMTHSVCTRAEAEWRNSLGGPGRGGFPAGRLAAAR